MKDIIIVGTGKAGFLHYYSYKKFKKIGEIYFVDIDGKIKNKNIEDRKVYLTLESVIKENEIDINNVIVDICTPKSVFMDIIQKCKRLNIKNIIVEKPFIVQEDFFEQNKELNIVMVHNYSYSKITKGIKAILEEKELTPIIVYTNFSKNRTKESFSGRGMYKKVTRNIEHDIPHQVYISQFLLGNCNNTKLLLEDEKAMVGEDVTLEKHGYSKIITKKDNVYVIHESDFATNTKIREVIIVCESDIVIHGEFLFYDKDLNKLKDGNIKIFQNNEIIYNENIDFDDNMYECLLERYNYLNGDELSEKYKEEINEFSKEMNIYINNKTTIQI